MYLSQLFYYSRTRYMQKECVLGDNFKLSIIHTPNAMKSSFRES